MKYAKRDGNHADVEKALRDAGIATIDLSKVGNDCPDILACRQDGMCVLVEVKMPKTGRLSAGQRAFAEKWPGPYCVATQGNTAVLAVMTAQLRSDSEK